MALAPLTNDWKQMIRDIPRPAASREEEMHRWRIALRMPTNPARSQYPDYENLATGDDDSDEFAGEPI